MFQCFFVVWMALCATFVSAAEFSTVRRYVYPIVTSTDKTNTVVYTGSGVTVADGYVLTVAHILPNKKESIYVHYKGVKPAEVIRVDAENDLALLRANVACPCAPISVATEFELDQEIHAVGYPLYSSYKLQILTSGTIQGVQGNNMIVTAHTAPGGSGGGIFGLERGQYKLMGIVKGAAAVDIGPQFFTIHQIQSWFVIGTTASVVRQFIRGVITPDVKKETRKSP